jgi:hypothetical protein
MMFAQCQMADEPSWRDGPQCPSDVDIAEGAEFRLNGQNGRQLESKRAVAFLNRDKQGY